MINKLNIKMIGKNILNFALVIVVSMIGCTEALGGYSEWNNVEVNSTELEFLQGLQNSV